MAHYEERLQNAITYHLSRLKRSYVNYGKIKEVASGLPYKELGYIYKKALEEYIKAKEYLTCEHKQQTYSIRYVDGHVRHFVACSECGAPMDLNGNIVDLQQNIKNILAVNPMPYIGSTAEYKRKVFTDALMRIKELHCYSYKILKAIYNQHYLKSRYWLDLSLRIRNERVYCENCGNKATAIHHLTYHTITEESDDDLMAVCEDCHKLLHHDPYKEEPFAKEVDSAISIYN